MMMLMLVIEYPMFVSTIIDYFGRGVREDLEWWQPVNQK